MKGGRWRPVGVGRCPLGSADPRIHRLTNLRCWILLYGGWQLPSGGWWPWEMSIHQWWSHESCEAPPRPLDQTYFGSMVEMAQKCVFSPWHGSVMWMDQVGHRAMLGRVGRPHQVGPGPPAMSGGASTDDRWGWPTPPSGPWPPCHVHLLIHFEVDEIWPNFPAFKYFPSTSGTRSFINSIFLLMMLICLHFGRMLMVKYGV
jgi:hypothetical protein